MASVRRFGERSGRLPRPAGLAPEAASALCRASGGWQRVDGLTQFFWGGVQGTLSLDAQILVGKLSCEE